MNNPESMSTVHASSQQNCKKTSVQANRYGKQWTEGVHCGISV